MKSNLYPERSGFSGKDSLVGGHQASRKKRGVSWQRQDLPPNPKTPAKAVSSSSSTPRRPAGASTPGWPQSGSPHLVGTEGPGLNRRPLLPESSTHGSCMGEADSRPTAKTHSEPCGAAWEASTEPTASGRGAGSPPEVAGPASGHSVTAFPGGSVGSEASWLLPLLEGSQGSQRAQDSWRAPTACPLH